VLWATDFIHHLDPTVIALGAGLSLALPKIGVLDTVAIKKVNFLIIIFSAGALSMATVLSRINAFDALNEVFTIQAAPLFSNSLLGSVVLYWGGILYHFIFPNNQSLLSTSLPWLLSVIASTPYNPAALGLIWHFAGGGTLFAYQSAVLVVGYAYGYFNSRDLVKFGAAMMIIEGVLIMIVVPLYWPLIGLNWIK
jgi:solute carrier family 13 (sodium-dependent dicarboxylate transporter), member 2/3/5